jgi:small subunit ribosomal protein S16
LAVKLRLRRMGKKKQPIYKMVAADARSPRDGKFLEAVGFYNPLTDPHTLDLKEDRIMYWLNVGAQPTHTVKSLLRQKGLILKKELISKGLDEEKVKSELEEWQKVKEAGSKKKTDKKLSKKAKAKQEAQASADAAPKEETAEEPKPEAEQEVKAPAESAAKEAAPEEPKAEVKEEKQDAADSAEKDAPAEESKSEDKKE